MTSMGEPSGYDRQFYADRSERTAPSARRILGIVRDHIPFRSVADFGCGTGTWLAVALRDYGAERAIGFEGDWMQPEWLDDPLIQLHSHDLEQAARPGQVDLAVSLEVAEHLSPGRAESFVSDLCQAAPAVLFGAAIPGQGGVGHVNEQWQSYWAELFAVQGYKCSDAVRPLVWDEKELPYWYRQNILLYSKNALEAPSPAILNLVHPDKWDEERSVPLSTRVRYAAKWKLKNIFKP